MKNLALPSHLECSVEASHVLAIETPAGFCTEHNAPLLARYPVGRLNRADLAPRPWTMWRYREVLPIADGDEPVSLGEGGTPIVALVRTRLDAATRCEILVKDESQNPTGSFKSRGMSAAVTAAMYSGAKAFVAPSAGNAGGALAAYAARAGLPARIYVPKDTPRILIDEMLGYGADVVLIDGLIDEAGRRAAEFARETGAFNVATFREPYRVEGKKTMGYELVEQLGTVPGTIVYPTGGGTGLVAMWKAFDELEAAGWIGSERPVLVSVQAEGCAPIVHAFHRGDHAATPVKDGKTELFGLRVPGGIGDRLTLAALRASGGHAVTVSDAQAKESMQELHKSEGIDAAIEGGATLAALRVLHARGAALASPVVLFNTATSLKYASPGS
jgi:threonine synthase